MNSDNQDSQLARQLERERNQVRHQLEDESVSCQSQKVVPCPRDKSRLFEGFGLDRGSRKTYQGQIEIRPKREQLRANMVLTLCFITLTEAKHIVTYDK